MDLKMNKVILLGRLTKAPEIRYSQTNNIKVATFSLAVNRKYVKPGEERQTDFINIVAYSKLAEFSEKYLKQGVQICICGRMQTRSYEDKNGITRYVTEVIAEEVDFADSVKKADESILWANPQNNTAESNTTTVNTNDSTLADDDLPF